MGPSGEGRLHSVFRRCYLRTVFVFGVGFAFVLPTLFFFCVLLLRFVFLRFGNGDAQCLRVNLVMTGCVCQWVVFFVHGCASGRADEHAFENDFW